MFRNRLQFLRWGLVSPPPNFQAGGPPLVGGPLLLIQYIRSCPPYLEADDFGDMRIDCKILKGVFSSV
jgi:hypothetical protein